MQLLRRINLADGFTGDADWTNPANTPPAAAGRLVATSSKILFGLIGKASTEDGAAGEDMGSMTFDAWIGLDVGGGVSRYTSVKEANGGVELAARVLTVEDDVEVGETYRLNIASLTNVGPASLWVYVISGARIL